MGFNVGSGGGWQNQNGQSSGSYTGDTSSTQTGSTTGSTSTTSAPVISQDWQSVFDQIRGNTGAGGLTSTQQTASNYIEDQMKNGGVTHLQSMAQKYPELYGKQPEVTAGTVGAAGTAAAGMSPYEAKYDDSVIGATMADLNQAYKESQNDLRAQYGGEGWSASAGSPASVQLAAAEGADKYLRTVGSTIGGLRDARFKTALGASQYDMGDKLSRDTTQAGLDTTASGQNAGILDSRQKFDATQATQNDLRRDNLASSLFSTGSGGFDQLLKTLGGAQTTIGQTNTGTTSGTTMGTTTSTQSGTTAGTNSTQGSGRQNQSSLGK